jgi:2-polyprenyl-6-methoxyphenol hydroxylase-like FAD-dependent oxidoreductase
MDEHDKKPLSTTVAIIGGGPAGATVGLLLASRGIDVVVIEKDRFPRFRIGESLTGESGALLRKLGLEARMKAQDFPVKHGTQVFGPDGKNGFWVPVASRDNPEQKQMPATTWQVRRADFDKMLLDEAKARGARTVLAEVVDVGVEPDGGVRTLRCKSADGERFTIGCQVVVDATGPSTLFTRLNLTGEKARMNYDNQVAIYSHAHGARRDEGEGAEDGGNTLIFYKERHHWAWFIPTSHDTTSIGVVVPVEVFRKSGESKEEFLKREMVQLNPNLTARLQDVTFVDEFRAASNYSYETADYSGKNWLCVGDAHKFIDPIFSFGA